MTASEFAARRSAGRITTALIGIAAALAIGGAQLHSSDTKVDTTASAVTVTADITYIPMAVTNGVAGWD